MNIQNSSQIKYYNVGLEKLNIVGLYCVIILQSKVQNT
jgi:hypothetical protein